MSRHWLTGPMTSKRRPPDPDDPMQQAIRRVADQLLASDNPQAGLAGLLRHLSAPAGPPVAATGMMAWRDNPHIALPKPPAQPQILTLRVDIHGARPPIWRRLDVRGELPLDEVHDILQVTFGWTDTHLHRFGGPGVRAWDRPYFITEADASEGEDGTPEYEARLDQVLRAPGDRLTYLYDFGDDWIHDIKLEKRRPATESDPPAVCRAGRNAGPPEDVGGIWSWNELAEALRADPDPRALSGDLEMYAEWLPEDIAPAAFDLEATNDLLAAWFAPPDLPPVHPTLARLLEIAEPTVATQILHLIALAADDPSEPTAEEAAGALRPWRAMIDAAGADGIRLTPAGWMAPAACERIWHESGLAWPVGKGNREQHTPELIMLREECTRAGLIRRDKGALVLSPIGRRAASDPEVLARTVADSLIDAKEPFDRDARALTLLHLAAGWRPGPDGVVEGAASYEWGALADEIARVLAGAGWRASGPLRYARDTTRLLDLLAAGQPGLRRGTLPDSVAARALARRAIFVP